MYSGIEYRVSVIGYRIFDRRRLVTFPVLNLSRLIENVDACKCEQPTTLYEDDDEGEKIEHH